MFRLYPMTNMRTEKIGVNSAGIPYPGTFKSRDLFKMMSNLCPSLPFPDGVAILEQQFSTFLMLQPFNTVPHVVMTPNNKMVFTALSQL